MASSVPARAFAHARGDAAATCWACALGGIGARSAYHSLATCCAWAWGCRRMGEAGGWRLFRGGAGVIGGVKGELSLIELLELVLPT